MTKPKRIGIRKRWIVVGAAALILVFLPAALDVLLDEPMRRHMESRLNRILVGYTIHITKLDFHVLGLSLDLIDATIVQNANPDPPVLDIPKLSASVQWRALLRARVVADFIVLNPRVHLNLQQMREEARDDVPVDDRGWQQALEAIYPLKINEFKIVGGQLTYSDEGPYRPIHMDSVFFLARNIRNLRSRDRTYPSEVHLDGRVFDTGRLVLDGHANFLAVPHAGIKTNLTVENVDLRYFEPLTRRYGLTVKAGTLSTHGLLEYAPWLKQADLREVDVDGAVADYVQEPATAAARHEAGQKIAQSAREVSNNPDIVLKVGRFRLMRSTIGYVNRNTSPSYRLYLTNADMVIDDLSNHLADGAAVASLKGSFMGSGSASALATFRPAKNGPNFDIDVRIRGTEMARMNDLFRAYGKFDVVGGVFSFYSEMKIANGRIDGYVKPFFKDVDVYDPKQDKEKGALRKVWEAVIGGIAKLLQNKREEVATKATLSGRVDNPATSPIEIIAHAIENAFFKAILPQLDKEIDLLHHRPRKAKAVRASR